MQRTFECSVCSDVYVPGTRPPKTLTCGHSFCASCLHILHKNSTVLCPKCRTTCSIPGDIDSLPTTFSILDILDSVCGECHNQSHSGKCNHCDKNVCDPCRAVHIGNPSGVPNNAPASNTTPYYPSMKYRKSLDDLVDQPRYVCLNPTTGDIIVTDYNSGKVHILSESLDLLHSFDIEEETGSFSCAAGVACDGQQVYIADGGNHRVCVTDVQGNMARVFGSRGSADDGFYSPRGLALDAAGLLYVCDGMNRRIKVVTNQGIYVREFGEDVFEDEEPYCIAVSEDNKVAVTDGTGNLYLFTNSGQHIRTIPAQTPPHYVVATCVLFDKHGNILVSDFGGRVLSMSESGDVRSQIVTAGTGRGTLRRPQGLAVTHNDNIVVCDTGNRRLVLFGTD